MDGEQSKSTNPTLNRNMVEILAIIVKGNQEGGWVDIDQLLERLTYHRSKQSVQFTIRNMVAKDLIYKAGTESRRGRKRVILAPTVLGNDCSKRAYSGTQLEEMKKLFTEEDSLL
jgi:hypothetical protein